MHSRDAIHVLIAVLVVVGGNLSGCSDELFILDHQAGKEVKIEIS